ncbi:MAG: aminotransferase class IV [Actinomycetota bacterium]
MTTGVTTRTIMIDGEVVAPGDDARPLLDDGLVRGDGVFEGMRLYGRRPRTPEAHLDRLALSARTVGLDVDVDVLRRELAEFCAATVQEDCGVRLMVTRGGQRIWREEPLPPERDSITVLPVPHRVTPLLAHAKTLSYAPNMQALRLAKAAGCDDALFIRADDRVVLEGPVTSFAWLEGDTLVFPPLTVGVLDSITRRLARDAVPTREREMSVDELAGADGALLMSTVIESVAVREVKDVAAFDPALPRLQEIRRAIREASAASAVPV